MDAKKIEKERAAAGQALANAEYQLKKSSWFKGRERSVRELRGMAGPAAFPLPPWSMQGWMESKASYAEKIAERDWAARAQERH